MRPLLILLATSLATPALSDVTYTTQARFGVSYRADAQNPGGQTQALYEGRFVAHFSHETDSGVRFRFDLGVVATNYDANSPMRSRSNSSRGN